MKALSITATSRFEFSAGHRLSVPPEDRFHGHNYTLWVTVAGEVDEHLGLVITPAELEASVHRVLDAYDHRNLNEDVPALHGAEPTVTAIASALWKAIGAQLPARVALAEVRLQEEAGPGASADRQKVYSLRTGTFAAAHRTHAPALSPEENRALYGICNNPAGHGHNYRVEARFEGELRGDPLASVLPGLDHRNLSVDIEEFAGHNVVTEGVARLIFDRLGRMAEGTPASVRVHELDNFYAECGGEARPYELGRRYRFHAAHRLSSARLGPAENEAAYGRCNRPGGHGHTYTVEAVVAGRLDPRTEAALDLGGLDRVAGSVIDELNYRHLDQDLPEFRSRPSTGENIACYLWRRLDAALGGALVRVRLWETANTSFAVERAD